MYKIRKMGCYSVHNKDFFINRPKGYDCYLLLLLRTPGIFYFGENTVTAKTGSLIIYKTGTPQKYGALQGGYSDDWMHIEETISHGLLERLPLDQVIYIPELLPLLTGYTQLISQEFFSQRANNELVLSSLIQAMLEKISCLIEQKKQILPYYTDLIMLRQQIYSNPAQNWSIPTMAHELGISTSYLHILYRNVFHTTCTKDVIKSRLEYSCQLLEDTSLSVMEISSICGYTDYEYFLKSFKKHIGITPKNYRKKSNSIN